MYTRLSMSEPKIPPNKHTLIPNHGTLIATDIRIRGGERRWDKLARATSESSTTGIESNRIETSKYGIEKAWLPRAPPKSQISGERFATREAFFPNLRLELAIKGGGWVGDYIWGQSMLVVQTDGADRALLCLATHDRTVGGGRLAVTRIREGKLRAPIGCDLEDGDLH
jgi:hypothetical protein